MHRGGGGPFEMKSAGQKVVESQEFKTAAATGQGWRGRVSIEVKSITSAPASAGGLVAPDISTTPAALPRRRLRIRDLVAPGRTVSNAVWWPMQVSRMDAASTVAENPSAPKPLADYPVSGIVLHPTDYYNLLAIKDSQNRYIAAGPMAPLLEALWSTPIVRTRVMVQGQLLLGAFKDAAQIFSREDANVLISSEDRDNFVKNMVTVKHAKTIKRRIAEVKIDLTSSLVHSCTIL